MTMQFDRRHFLGTSAGLAAGLLLSGSAHAASAATLPEETASPDGAASPENLAPVRVGLMGCGGRGRALAANFGKQPEVRVVAICDPDSERLATTAAEIGKATNTTPESHADVRKLLDQQAIDVLIIAAPNHWHGPAAIMACSAGKHVYVEKPCCHNPAEGEMMIAAARRHRRCVQVGTQRRSNAAIREGVALVHAGAIGEAYYARAWYANRRGPIGTAGVSNPPANLDYDLWQGPAPRQPFHANYLHYNWHWFWNWGNGELGNNGPHALDLARWALNVDFPTQVSSTGGRYAYQDDQQTPDTQVVSYGFEGGKQILWEGLSCNKQGINGKGFGATVHGKSGTLEFTGDGYVQFDDRGQEVHRNSGGGPGDVEHIVNFIAAVRANDPARLNCNVEIGYRSTLLPLLGNISQRVGRSISCSPETGHIIGNDEASQFWSRSYAPGWKPQV